MKQKANQKQWNEGENCQHANFISSKNTPIRKFKRKVNIKKGQLLTLPQKHTYYYSKPLEKSIKTNPTPNPPPEPPQPKRRFSSRSRSSWRRCWEAPVLSAPNLRLRARWFNRRLLGRRFGFGGEKAGGVGWKTLKYFGGVSGRCWMLKFLVWMSFF